MAVELRFETAGGRRFAPMLKSDARALMRLLELGGWELSIVIVDDQSIRVLNRDFRMKDRPTDVLSFSQLDGAAPAKSPVVPMRVLGDVVISIDTALRQARRRRITPASRIRALLIHGVLHLLGYDHERSLAEARRMFARERELAAKLARVRRPGARAGRPASSLARKRAGALRRPR